MKKIFTILAIVALFVVSSCEKDYLNTDPTDKVSGTSIFSDAENAVVAVNGLYRLMYSPTNYGWDAENGGYPAHILAFDLMGEDHIMDGSGSGWYWEDYEYGIWGDYKSKAGRQYHFWYFYYKLITSANYILANVDENGEPYLPGDQDVAKYVLANAYAVRAFAYMNIVQAFCQHSPSAPGVPLYTDATVAGSEGKGRGTVQQVYDQANSDIDKAIELFEASSTTQMHKSHIDKYVAYGLKARHALIQGNYAEAETAAVKAMAGASICPISDILHVNSNSAKDAMWGLGIQTDQAIGNYDIYAHMDADSKGTYSRARHLISNWLYEQLPQTDARRQWWTPDIPAEEWGTPGSANGSYRSYCQKKLVYINVAESTGDHILMRVEEMYLIAAEAACAQGKFTEARKYISDLAITRDPNYAARLDKFSDSSTYNDDTVGTLTTLMDEILFQRRIELWGEIPRMFDLQRLGLGFHRDWNGTNHTITLSGVNTSAGSPAFILWIPQAEFDGNENMDATKDQNPNPRS